MSRSRKKRITCESDLFIPTESPNGGIFGPPVHRVHFFEDVDYKMSGAEETSQPTYVTMEVVDR